MPRKRKESKPTVTEILSKLTQAQEYWSQLHFQMDENYRILKDKQAVIVPKGYNVVRLGTANSIISTAADHIVGDSPKVRVPEAGLSKAAQERSEAIEDGFQAALWRFQSASTENPVRTLVVNALWSGMMVAKGPLFLADEWGKIPIESDFAGTNDYQAAADEYEDTKKVSWPFYWRAVDPRYVFPDPGTVGRKWVIVSYERTVGDIAAQWPSWNKKTPGMHGTDKPLSDTTEVQWVEFWDEHYKAYLVGGRPVGNNAIEKADLLGDVYEHTYGKPPFQIRASGYGSDSGKPHERFESIIERAKDLLNQQIVVATQIDAIMRRTAWPIVLAPLNSGFDSIEPGTVKEMERDDIAAVRSFTELQPQIPQMLLAEFDHISSAIEHATFPNVVQGIKAKGIASGYGQNSLVAQAKVKYGSAVINLSSLLSEMFVDFGRCIQYVVEEPVYIWGQTKWGMVDAVLKPSDINDLRHVEVMVNPKIPTDSANDLAMAQIALQLGLIDIDTAITDFLHYEQPGEMRVKILRDKALQSPEIQRVLTLHAALKGGYIDKLMEMATEIGMDPGQLLQVIGFGAPQQQTPAAQSFGGQPQNVASQVGASGMAPPQNSPAFGGNMKPQPTPGGPSDIRNRAAPGIPIG